jgi:hypothetical protein
VSSRIATREVAIERGLTIRAARASASCQRTPPTPRRGDRCTASREESRARRCNASRRVRADQSHHRASPPPRPHRCSRPTREECRAAANACRSMLFRVSMRDICSTGRACGTPRSRVS